MAIVRNVTNYNGTSSMDTIYLQNGCTDGSVVRGGAGNDTFFVYAGKDHYMQGGSGNDKYNFRTLAADSNYIVDQTNAAATDSDFMLLQTYNSSEFIVEMTNDGNLILTHGELNTTITILGWEHHALTTIQFKDGAVTVQGLAYTASCNNYNLKMSGEYIFAGTNTVNSHDSIISNAASNGVLNVRGNNNTYIVNGGTINVTSGDNLVVQNNVSGGVVNINGGDAVTVYTGEGNSQGDAIIEVNAGSNHTIVGGDFNDTIIVNGGSVSRMQGGAGNDSYIINVLNGSSSYVIDQTNAGAGDTDTIVINGYNKEAFAITKADNGDLVLTNGELNTTITVEGWGNNAVQGISFANGNLSAAELNGTPEPGNGGVEVPTIEGVSQQSVIRDFMAALDNTVNRGTDALNEAVAICSRGFYSDAQELIDSFVAACVNYGGTTVEAQKAFLLEYCGIDLDNEDTGAISGSDAGGAVSKNYHDIVAEPDDLTVNDLVYNFTDKIIARDYYTGLDREFTCATIDCNGENLTIYWDEAQMDKLVEKGLISNRGILNDIVSGVIQAWSQASFELIEESYGISLTDADSKLMTLSNGNKGLQLCIDYASSSVRSSFVLGSYNWTAAVSSSANSIYVNDMKTTSVAREALLINTYYFQNQMTDLDARSSGTNQYLDRVISHEMVHGAMAANVNCFSELPLFIKEGLAELVIGADDIRRSELLSLANLNKRITMTSGTTYDQAGMLEKIFALSGSTSNMGTYAYAGGYALMRYMAKEIAEYSTTEAGSVAFSSEFDYESFLNDINSSLVGFENDSLGDDYDYSSVAENDDKLKITGNC